MVRVGQRLDAAEDLNRWWLGTYMFYDSDDEGYRKGNFGIPVEQLITRDGTFRLQAIP